MHARHRSVFVLFAALVFGSGCAAPAPSTPGSVAQAPSPIRHAEWVSDGLGIDRLDYQFATDTDAVATIYRFDQQKLDLHFVQSAVGHPVSDWMSRLPGAAMVVNGVYFKEDDLPAGFFATSATRVGLGHFDLDKSGTIILGKDVQIVDTATHPLELGSLRDAGQSYPLLIRDGKPALQKGSELVARRSFIGLDTAGDVYVGVIAHTPVTLFQLMEVLEKTGIIWETAINLDGGPSTGIGVRNGSQMDLIDSFTPIPNVIVAEPLK